MKLKSFALAIITILITLYSSVQITHAASVSFDIEINTQEAKKGDEVEVTITGHNIIDLYGYEMELSIDTSMLQFKKASSGISSLIYPIETSNDGTFLLVSTKMGNVSGASGEVMLGKVIFEVIGEGKEVGIKLNKVKLATSSASSTRHEVNERIQIRLVEEPKENSEISFTDISGHWAEDKIRRAVELGFIKGYGDETFRPDREVSRDEFAVMIYQAFEYEANSMASLPFKDQALIESWAREAISALAAEGIINGYDDGTFRPDRSINRSEMAVMMASIVKLDVNSSNRSTFSDASDMQFWAEPSIAAVAKEKLLQGRGNNMFKPNGLMTRAEAVQVIISMMDYMNPPTE
ncbi:S-layer homology domain-containing protein [Paenibacillus sp. PAMC21692]|uniref:S-layer homology domain-containing protein n=1 Tax=Paenibacillus sp. PAMC21692 TaxID=2762320 RepID=UPI00164E5BE6|nr:S-layer homology domain-containing protein [Paenibacillus sp. PAMC21692]QNK56748.1 S-layer homology domain-containing protein [Paenibacillus sp. PAMC21692]